jgi:methionyl aminopeptidase
MSIESAADFDGMIRAGRVVYTGGYVADAATTVLLAGASDRSQQLRDTAISAFDAGCRTDVLADGLVLTIEPLIAEWRTRVVEGEDGWTLRTRNGCLAAHHEHTIIITSGAPTIVML